MSAALSHAPREELFCSFVPKDRAGKGAFMRKSFQILCAGILALAIAQEGRPIEAAASPQGTVPDTESRDTEKRLRDLETRLKELAAAVEELRKGEPGAASAKIAQ